MLCESCNRRPATMRATIRRKEGEQHILMLCGMCAHKFTNVMTPSEVSRSRSSKGTQLFPDLFVKHQFPTQRYGTFLGFSTLGQEVIKRAEAATRELNLAYVGTIPLMMGVVSFPNPTGEILHEYGIERDGLVEAVDQGISSSKPVERDDDKKMFMSQDALQALEIAQHQAMGGGDNFVEPQHVVLGIIDTENSSAVGWMKGRGIDLAALENDVSSSLKKAGTYTEIVEATPDEILLGPETGPEAGPAAESALAAYSRNITDIARRGELMPVVGRDAEIGRSMRILARMQKNNPLLLGEPGVGKTAIVEALAQQIVQGDVPRRLQNCNLYEVDLTAMVAGTKMRGEFEKRMKDLVKEVKRLGPSVILFIDEIHTLVGAGASEGSMDAGNILKPGLARGEMRMIGATTLNEYRKYIEKDPALSRRFQPVLVGEPSVEQAICILEGIKWRFEKHHGVSVSPEAASAAVTLSSQYLTERFLPDKAIDLIDEACSMVAIENDDKGFERAVIADDVAQVISSWTGIPLTKMIEPEKKRLLQMEEIIHRRLVDQDEAVDAVSDVIRRSRAGLKDPTKPNGAFLFAGPTGVGKTELARSLAGFLFDDDSALVRLDMSEFAERESMSRLMGAPPGYVGFEEGGQLTEKVRFRPYSVVLFDEMEKAHPQVLNLLLQIADHGCLTDGQGREVNFKNTVIILTSNVGAELYYAQPPLTREEIKRRVTDMLISATSPELINRMDAVVLFNPLSKIQVKEIIELQLGHLSGRLSRQGISLEVEPGAIEYLTHEGFDPAMGARPAKRVIQNKIESPLSEMILSGAIHEDQKAIVTLTGDRLEIRGN